MMRAVDHRLLSRPGARKHALLEELVLKQPQFLIGFLKMPATHVGTSRERLVNENLGALCSQQLRAGRQVILMGPPAMRSLELPGIRDLVRQEQLLYQAVCACCLGCSASPGQTGKQIVVLTSFAPVKACNCGAEPAVHPPGRTAREGTLWSRTLRVMLDHYANLSQGTGVDEKVASEKNNQSQISSINDSTGSKTPACSPPRVPIRPGLKDGTFSCYPFITPKPHPPSKHDVGEAGVRAGAGAAPLGN